VGHGVLLLIEFGDRDGPGNDCLSERRHPWDSAGKDWVRDLL
jgi:hypothetical protein